jgi:hypothetical protein
MFKTMTKPRHQHFEPELWSRPVQAPLKNCQRSSGQTLVRAALYTQYGEVGQEIV